MSRSTCLILLLLTSGPTFAQALTYATYLRAGFTPTSIATGTDGSVFLSGNTTLDLGQQVAPMAMKLDPQGKTILYTSLFGGTSAETASGIAVDAAGNAYIVGTASPNPPITSGGQPASPPAQPPNTQTFLVKLDPQGNILLSKVLGNVSSFGFAVAITPQGQILVSGLSNAKGFAATKGAYSVADTTGRPFLMELSADGSQILFTATGIGGNALAFDSAGNIYMAGSTMLTDYPTTPGAYQTVFKPVYVCFGLCQLGFPGGNQYLTKVDPGATKLIYSTAVAGTGQTTNDGLAIDAAGSAYLTGISLGAYPYTVAPPSGAVTVQSFLTKLDPSGATAIYSVPIGGAGVALSGNNVFAGGSYNSIFYGIAVGLPLAGPPPGVTGLQKACQVNNLTTGSQAYISELDAGTGQATNTLLVDSSNSAAVGIALVGASSVWLAGTAMQVDVPITAGAVFQEALTPRQEAPTPGFLSGAILAEADFSAAISTGAPQLGCVLDAANLSRVGLVAPNQILTLIGTNLNGAAVTFDSKPATVLYSSPNQFNVVVPYSAGDEPFTTMQVWTSAGASVARELPAVSTEPSLFVDLFPSLTRCARPAGELPLNGFPVVARNQDGSMNSCANPAHSGSNISLFLNGLGGEPTGNGAIIPLLPSEISISVSLGKWSAEVVNVAAENQWVWRVDVLVPPLSIGENPSVSAILDMGGFPVTVGPLTPALPGGSATATGAPLPMGVWLAP